MIVKYVTSDWKHEGFFKVSNSMKISELKKHIARKVKIPRTRILLAIGHKFYDDDRPLRDCEIKSGGEIRVIIETKGKKIKKPKIIGPIDGIKVGAEWSKREHVAKAGVHTPRQQGISGDSMQGANSIVLSGGYEDDWDFGNVIFYTGAGPRDKFGKPNAHQTLTRGNEALAISCRAPLNRSIGAISWDWPNGVPVRVVRKVEGMIQHEKKPNKWRKTELYRYGGIYKVLAYWRKTREGEYDVWRYILLKDDYFDPDKVNAYLKWYFAWFSKANTQNS